MAKVVQVGGAGVLKKWLDGMREGVRASKGGRVVLKKGLGGLRGWGCWGMS